MKKKYWCAVTALGLTGAVPTLAQAAAVLSPNDFIIAIDADPAASQSNYPVNEYPGLAIDGDPSTKYLNFGKLETGFIVTPAIGSTTVRSLQFSTANDAADRDPASYVLEGSLQSFTQDQLTAADNGNGGLGTWTQISTGTLALPAARLTADAVIERMVYKTPRKMDVVVVTSDRGVRDLCRGMGALVMDAANFLSSLEETRSSIRETVTNTRKPAPAHLEERLDSDSLARLQALRKKL